MHVMPRVYICLVPSQILPVVLDLYGAVWTCLCVCVLIVYPKNIIHKCLPLILMLNNQEQEIWICICIFWNLYLHLHLHLINMLCSRSKPYLLLPPCIFSLWLTTLSVNTGWCDILWNPGVHLHGNMYLYTTPSALIKRQNNALTTLFTYCLLLMDCRYHHYTILESSAGRKHALNIIWKPSTHNDACT